MLNLSRVGRSSIQERVYRELCLSLVHGAFAAGQVLRMQALADAMDTSIMPVREALGRLVSEQALEVMPNRSVRVPLMSEARMEDLERVRCLIEGDLVRMAAARIDAETLEKLKRLTDACEVAFTTATGDVARETSVLNHDFHFTVYRASCSEVLVPIVNSLWLQSGPYVRAAAVSHVQFPSESAVRHHWEIIEYLSMRDAEGAVASLHADITQSFDLIRRSVATEGRLASADEGEAHV